MRFTKMHGCGNDYIYLDCTQDIPVNLSALAIQLSKPHFGIGSDGLICVLPSDKADFKMRIFNADGSEAEMCGNGLRCVGKFVYDKGLTSKTGLNIETLAGIRAVQLNLDSVTVDMGIPAVERACSLAVRGKDYLVTPVSIGNPHAVVFVSMLSELELSMLGPGFERHPRFAPHRVNTEFVQVLDREHLSMRVWERGSGETLACGTGACAALVAAVTAGLCERTATVSLPGGEVEIRWDESDNHIYMTGPAVTVFEGEIKE